MRTCLGIVKIFLAKWKLGFARNHQLCMFLRTPKEAMFWKPHPSHCSFVRSLDRLFFQATYSTSPWFKKKVACGNNCQVTVRASFEGDVSRTAIRRKKLAVFVSGGGSNFRSIHEASFEGLIHGDIVVVVTNKHGCGGAEYAIAKNIPVILFPKTKDELDGLSTFDLVSTLRRLEVDFVLLAGYLKLIPLELIQAYPRYIINIHPSLLPAFGGNGYYGMKVHKAVLASGARYSGPTIHFVDEHFDTGRILAQRVVPLLVDDTAHDLAARVLEEEHDLYVEVVAALCEERVVWREDGVPFIQSKENPDKFP